MFVQHQPAPIKFGINRHECPDYGNGAPPQATPNSPKEERIVDYGDSGRTLSSLPAEPQSTGGESINHLPLGIRAYEAFGSPRSFEESGSTGPNIDCYV